MELRLRQVVLVARDKAATVAAMDTALGVAPVHGSGDLSPYGLPAEGPMSEGGRQVLAKLGVENLIFPIGADFIEVMFPTRPDGATVGFMDRRGGDSGYMLVLQTDDVARYEVLAQREGVRISHKAEFPHYRDIHLHPRDCGGALLSMARNLPDNSPDGPWYPAGTAWETRANLSRVAGLAAAELRSPEPAVLAARWGRLLDLPVEAGEGHWLIRLEHGALRFAATAPGQKEGLCGIDLRLRGPGGADAAEADRTLQLCGMTVRLVA
ncbi:MAG TPA: VOC family protein [Novosphingobium sp.]